MNDKKNIIIGLLIIIVVLLAAWIISSRNKSESVVDSTQTATPTELTLPTPSPEATATTPAPSPTPTPAAFAETFADNNWLLETITLDGSTVDMNVNVPAALTLNFDKAKKSYSGFAGCNNFSGTYAASSPNMFSFGAAVSNKKYCMQSSGLEGKLFSAMGKVETFVITNGKLMLQSKDGKTKITYKEAI